MPVFKQSLINKAEKGSTVPIKEMEKGKNENF